MSSKNSPNACKDITNCWSATDRRKTCPDADSPFQTTFSIFSGLNLNQDKATKPQTVQIVRQGEATPYWFKFNPL
ncbi:transposase [Neisseria mucosa]|nr:transposase [Neisseria mucosa]